MRGCWLVDMQLSKFMLFTVVRTNHKIHLIQKNSKISVSICIQFYPETIWFKNTDFIFIIEFWRTQIGHITKSPHLYTYALCTSARTKFSIWLFFFRLFSLSRYFIRCFSLYVSFVIANPPFVTVVPQFSSSSLDSSIFVV